MKPLNWLSVKWALFLMMCLKAFKHCACNKIMPQYIVCAGKLGSMSCCLVWQQSILMFMLVISMTCQILNPIPLYEFYCGWCVRVLHTDQNRSAVISKMIMRVCSLCHQWLCQSLSGGCNIIALLGWCDFVTVKGTVSANIVDTDNTGQFFAVNIVS